MSGNMHCKALVVADIHDEVRNLEQIFARETDFDTLLFLGDGEKKLSQFLPIEGVEYIAVRGNNDHFSDLPTTVVFKKANRRILATHGKSYQVQSDLFTLMAVAQEQDVDLCLFGHTHHMTDIQDENIRYLNPGAVQRGRYAILEITDGEVTWTPNELPPTPDENSEVG